MRNLGFGALAALTLAAGVVVAHPNTAHHRLAAAPAVHAARLHGVPVTEAAFVTTTAPRAGLTAAASVPDATVVGTLDRASALNAVLDHAIMVYSRPHGRVRETLAERDELGSRRVLLVVDRRSDGWLRVMLPQRPNGSTGWIRQGAVHLSKNLWRVSVSLGRRQLRLFHDGKVVERVTVGIGSRSTPTPTGLSYVTDRILTDDPGGAYGPVALGISSYSDVLHHFNGGPGQIAIHGTNQSWTIGQRASHGCVHVANSELMHLYHLVPLGTPVDVH